MEELVQNTDDWIAALSIPSLTRGTAPWRCLNKGAIGLCSAAPMAAIRPATPMPSIRYYTAAERYVRGVPLVVPPALQQILDLKVRAAQVEQVHKLRPHSIVLVS